MCSGHRTLLAVYWQNVTESIVSFDNVECLSLSRKISVGSICGRPAIETVFVAFSDTLFGRHLFSSRIVNFDSRVWHFAGDKHMHNNYQSAAWIADLSRRNGMCRREDALIRDVTNDSSCSEMEINRQSLSASNLIRPLWSIVSNTSWKAPPIVDNITLNPQTNVSGNVCYHRKTKMRTSVTRDEDKRR